MSYLKVVLILGIIILFLAKPIRYSYEKKSSKNSEIEYICENDIYSEIYYTAEDEEFIYLIKILIATYYPLLCEDLDFQPEKVKVVIYSDKDLLMSALQKKSLDVPMGAYYDGIIHILSPKCWIEGEEAGQKEVFAKQGPIVHELVHFIIDKKANKRVEEWFNEGCALYFEYKYLNCEWRPDLSEKAKSVSSEDLRNNFKNIDKSLAYRKSFEEICGMVEKYGEEKIIKKLCK